jgi:AcrR family transcriptional regulator
MQYATNSRRLILQEAYKLFLTNNVEKGTIEELERASQKVRGTIFYHFRNKQNIFESVVDELFLPSLAVPTNIQDIIDTVSLRQFIELYESPEKRAINQIKEIYHIDQPEMSYYNFVFQAYKYYEDFDKKINNVMSLDIEIWKTVIDNAHKSKELICNHSTEELVILFTSFVTGLPLKEKYFHSLNLDYSQSLTKLYSFIQRRVQSNCIE